VKTLSVLLVGKGPPDSGGISAMLSTLQRHLTPLCTVDVLNLTRDRGYTAGVLSATNVGRTIADTVRVFRLAGAYDVVYVHSAFVPSVTIVRAGLLLIAARLRRARTILHVHGGSLPEWASSKVRRWLIRIVAPAASIMISVSDGITTALPAKRTVTIYNGVDTDTFVPGERGDGNPPAVMYAGLLTRRKGVVDLMEASRLLLSRGVAHRLVIVGGRPDEGVAEEQEVLAVASGLEDFIGAIPHREMPEYLQRADVFCLPSWFEAMPLSILEALASGLPVVASRVGQIPQVINDDVGRLVEPHDPEGLADALEELLTDKELRRRLGSNGRALAMGEYSLESTVSEILDVVQAVGAQRRAN
jgi:glycosyltransferase involved in cell wall biosynthesis